MEISYDPSVYYEAGVYYADSQYNFMGLTDACMYHWEHQPSGLTGVETVYCRNQFEFMKLLNRWNQVAISGWKYWV